jgi:hypothetical protein
MYNSYLHCSNYYILKILICKTTYYSYLGTYIKLSENNSIFQLCNNILMINKSDIFNILVDIKYDIKYYNSTFGFFFI